MTSLEDLLPGALVGGVLPGVAFRAWPPVRTVVPTHEGML